VEVHYLDPFRDPNNTLVAMDTHDGDCSTRGDNSNVGVRGGALVMESMHVMHPWTPREHPGVYLLIRGEKGVLILD